MSVRKIAFAFFASILFLVSACTAFAPAGPTATPTPISVEDPSFLAGLWKGEYDGSEVIMTFNPDGTIGITAYGNLQAGTYTLNTGTDPYQLDIELTDFGTITTIILFVDSNTIKIENIYPYDPRPSTFEDYFLLTRAQ